MKFKFLFVEERCCVTVRNIVIAKFESPKNANKKQETKTKMAGEDDYDYLYKSMFKL